MQEESKSGMEAEHANPLESALVDAPRNALARAAQEDAWAGTFDADARAQFSQREIAKLHRRRIEEAMLGYHVALLFAEYSERSFSSSPDASTAGRIVDLLVCKLSTDLLGRILEFAHGEELAEVFRDEIKLGHTLCQRRVGLAPGPASTPAPFRVALRVRPLLPFEVQLCEYNCMAVRERQETEAKPGGGHRPDPDLVVCHNGQVDRSGRKVSVSHRRFAVDRAWGGDADNATVFNQEVAPLLHTAMQGGQATVLCYGQTGTGKTHTLMACIDEICAALQRDASTNAGANANADADARSDLPAGTTGVSVRFFEIHGNACYDLMRNRKKVFLRAASDESVHVRGAVTTTLGLSELADGRLRAVLEEALRLRSSEATERNPLSSRSHAVLQLQFLKQQSEDSVVEGGVGGGTNGGESRADATSVVGAGVADTATATAVSAAATPASPGEMTCTSTLVPLEAQQNMRFMEQQNRAEAMAMARLAPANSVTSNAGQLTLVDLAGSERNYETVKMTAAQHRDSAEINKALMALKDCFRAFHIKLNQESGGAGAAAASDGRSRSTRSRLRPKTVVRTGTAPDASASAGGDGNAAQPKPKPKPASKAAHRLRLATQLKPATSIFEGTLDSGGAGVGDGGGGADIAEARAKAAAARRGRGARSLRRLRRAEASREKAMAAHRMPFRASRLTQLLRGCFTEEGHRSVIITTASPSSTDVAHSINSAAHVVLTKPELGELSHTNTTESPVFSSTGSFSNRPVERWDAEDVSEWVCSASNGQFAHLVLPPGLRGVDLLQLADSHVTDLGALFGGSMRDARGDGEGMSWAIDATTTAAAASAPAAAAAAAAADPTALAGASADAGADAGGQGEGGRGSGIVQALVKALRQEQARFDRAESRRLNMLRLKQQQQQQQQQQREQKQGERRPLRQRRAGASSTPAKKKAGASPGLKDHIAGMRLAQRKKAEQQQAEQQQAEQQQAEQQQAEQQQAEQQ